MKMMLKDLAYSSHENVLTVRGESRFLLSDNQAGLEMVPATKSSSGFACSSEKNVKVNDI